MYTIRAEQATVFDILMVLRRKYDNATHFMAVPYLAYSHRTPELLKPYWRIMIFGRFVEIFIKRSL
jgi:hypothetical protein